MDEVPAVQEPENTISHSRKNLWIAGGVLIFLAGTVGALVLGGVFSRKTPDGQALVAGGNGCPAVEKVSLDDFQNPPQAPWVSVPAPEGFPSAVLVPKGSHEESGAADIFGDSIVKLAQIPEDIHIKDPASLKIFYQGNLAIYAADSFNAYFIYPPSDWYQSTGQTTPYVAVIPGADVASFVPLEADVEHSYTGFAVDKNHVYFLGEVIPELTPANFRMLAYYYGLTSDASGQLELLAATEGVQRTDASHSVTRRPLTPLEASYIKAFAHNPYSTTTPTVAFSYSNAPIKEGAEIRTISESDSGLSRRYLPSIYGVFEAHAHDPSLCFAAEDGALRDSALYTSHALLDLFKGLSHTVLDVDSSLRNPIAYVLPFKADYPSEIVFDKAHQALFLTNNDGGSTYDAEGYTLRRFSFSDVIAHNATGQVLAHETGVGLRNLTISKAGGVAVALRGSENAGYDMVTVDLNTGAMHAIAPAGGGRSLAIPLFFSSDDKKLFYWIAPYEQFGGPSPLLFAHPLYSDAGFNTAAEITPIPLWSMLENGNDSIVYYLYAKSPHTSCDSLIDGADDYTDTLAAYNTVKGSVRDLFTAPGGQLLSHLKFGSDEETISVRINGEVASSSNGTACAVQGPLLETKSLSL